MSAAAPARKKAKPQPKARDESKQAEANRRNSKKSTGPRTAAGKGRSKFNAVTHGLTTLSPCCCPVRIPVSLRPGSSS